MSKPKIPAEFIVKIAIKDETGRVIGEKEFITYAGLLAVAHDIGLEQINTTIVQMPTDGNGQTAVVRAVAKGKPGLFTGLGDASPGNVNKKVARHLLRVAETRAKARALRDLCNINMLALEELGDDADLDIEHPRPTMTGNVVSMQSSREPRAERAPRSNSITDAQRRALFRKALARGIEGNDAGTYITRRLGVAIERATKDQASKLLDDLTREERGVGANGGGHAA